VRYEWLLLLLALSFVHSTFWVDAGCEPWNFRLDVFAEVAAVL
jgi:hypothetical protein